MDDSVKPVSFCSSWLHLAPLLWGEEFLDSGIVLHTETLFWAHPSGVWLPLHVVSEPAQCVLFWYKGEVFAQYGVGPDATDLGNGQSNSLLIKVFVLLVA